MKIVIPILVCFLLMPAMCFAQLRHPDIYVSGITIVEEGPVAIINNKITREGDIVNGVKILRIHSSWVECEYKEEVFKRKIGEGRKKSLKKSRARMAAKISLAKQQILTKLKANLGLAPVLVTVGTIAAFIGGIILLVGAFRHGTITGVLSLILPFYILYFAFVEYDSQHKGKVLVLWLGGFGLYLLGAMIIGRMVIPFAP